ncbi:Gfo/Idh/MocA family protein [Patulibacter americanus]|uniref:Gfo/Idh/MocA family protein n=1 Tax=Patulibacter americanus TaxID=588672 RepID=UPI000A06BE4E|nr:Gfo/Idh/MocA family oxidoreductase [Patulibacter americanus]
MSTPIGVGIVGVNAERGWAADAHVPALRALPGYRLAALSTTRQESAEAAGRAFGVPLTFANHVDLVAHPEVQLVVVTVKVPHHREIVDVALAAGKDVYCEWPLGRGLADARAMVDRAADRGVRTLVGLQPRVSPTVLRVRELIADGYLGTVLSTTMVGSSRTGGTVDRGNAYTLERRNAAGMLDIAAAHSLDAMAFVLGDFRDLSAVLDTRRPAIGVDETGEILTKTAPDQLGVVGRLASGVTAAVHFREGHHGGTGFLWEINGTHGTLQLRAEGGHPGHFPLTLAGSRGGEPLAVLPPPQVAASETPELAALRGTPARNVARMYEAFDRDRKTGSRDAPDFAQALAPHRLIATIERAAASGERATVDRGWPGHHPDA